MFRRVTVVGCGISGRICRNLSTPATSHFALGQPSANIGRVPPPSPCIAVGFTDSSCRQDFKKHASRNFASKAASKFSKRIKKETFDRFMGMDPSRLQHGFNEIKELEDASEEVKRIFSLEFAPGRQIKKIQQIETFEEVEQDPTDRSYTNYLFTSIAKCTVAIRNLASHLQRFPRDKSNKRLMLLMIDRRRKHIKFLRRINFDLSQRLLEKLNIDYTPLPKYCIRKNTKRYLEKKAICEQAFLERKKALHEFTSQLKEEQLKEIAILKKDLGMDMTEEEQGRL